MGCLPALLRLLKTRLPIGRGIPCHLGRGILGHLWLLPAYKRLISQSLRP